MSDRPIDLFLDYDGTLVPIKRRPSDAVLSEARRESLRRLAEGAFVCIVTGRSMADIRRHVSLPEIAYIANHGLEIRWRGGSWIHPEAAGSKRALKDLLRKIGKAAEGVRGLLIENKGVTASIHLRGLSPASARRVRAIVGDAVGRGRGPFRLGRGKKVLEILPDVDWDKGRGVLFLQRRRRKPAGKPMVYIGDDRTDEDAFRLLGGRTVTIRVGLRGRTSARRRLPDVAAVWAFLRDIAGD